MKIIVFHESIPYIRSTPDFMLPQIRNRLYNRQNAGRLLAEKLVPYKHTDAIVFAIPRGGIPVGQEIATTLGLAFDMAFLRRIKHPAHSDLSIGAVSLDEIILHESHDYIPQNYIQNQVALLQRALRDDFNRHYEKTPQQSLTDKIVIVVDDVLREMDEISACIHGLRKHAPRRIVAAAAVASVQAVNLMMEEQIEFHYLLTEFRTQTKAHSYFPEVSEEEMAAPYEISKGINLR